MENKIYPFFEVNGKTYEIIRTRALECEYEKVIQNSKASISVEDDECISRVAKAEAEYVEMAEKFEKAKEDFFNEPLNADKMRVYELFEKLAQSKLDNYTNCLKQYKNVEQSIQKLYDLSYSNGLKILIFALCERYNLTQNEATKIWEQYENEKGKNTAREWIIAMSNTLFANNEEETDPFLKQAKAKAQQKAESRKGLEKIKR